MTTKEDFAKPFSFEHFVLEPEAQSRIGPAWRLFLLVYYRSDRRGFLKLTHRQLARLLDTSLWTIRAWRRHLCDRNVIDSMANSRYVIFYLKEPWLTVKQNEVGKHEGLAERNAA